LVYDSEGMPDACCRLCTNYNTRFSINTWRYADISNQKRNPRQLINRKTSLVRIQIKRGGFVLLRQPHLLQAGICIGQGYTVAASSAAVVPVLKQK
jgi:hypothetical protein